MKRQVTNFGEKESMIVMYACKHWSKEKHKMFVQRRYMVKKMIKYIRDIALLNSFIYFFLLRDRKTKNKVKLKDIEEYH